MSWEEEEASGRLELMFGWSMEALMKITSLPAELMIYVYLLMKNKGWT